MARPKIGIFGALMALGALLAVRYAQRNRAVQVPAARELSRWEDEGGKTATPSGSVPAASANPSTPGAAHGADGPAHLNGQGRAWPFPRS